MVFGRILAVSGAAMADELADAHKALETKAYPQALQLYGKLAAAGNPVAQLRLGEMYWYGEGVALDRAKGDALFAQAAASGNAEAIAARTLTARRAQHAAGIALWTTGYDGADLTAGKYNCPAPVIPAVSKTNAEIAATNAGVAAWRVCYDGFAANLNAGLPPGKQIPAEVAEVMSEPEVQQAKAHIDKVYGAVMDKAQVAAQAVIARQAAWETATVASVEEQNRLIAARTKQVKADLETAERWNQNARMGDLSKGSAPTPSIKK